MSKGTKKQKKLLKKTQTHGPELADADDGLCFVFLFWIFAEQNSAPRNLKKLSPHDDPFCILISLLEDLDIITDP